MYISHSWVGVNDNAVWLCIRLCMCVCASILVFFDACCLALFKVLLALPRGITGRLDLMCVSTYPWGYTHEKPLILEVLFGVPQPAFLSSSAILYTCFRICSNEIIRQAWKHWISSQKAYMALVYKIPCTSSILGCWIWSFCSWAIGKWHSKIKKKKERAKYFILVDVGCFSRDVQKCTRL